MTQKQLEVLVELQKQGWNVVHLGMCCGGPVHVDSPDGKPYTIKSDGELVPDED